MSKEKSRVSIKDIADALDISTTTVSFVMNGKAKNKISEEVIQKVEKYISEVGYKPNSSAQSLRTGKSKTILYMAEDISDPFFSAIAKEMEELAFNSGYKIIYCSTENKKEKALELLSFFREKQVDAFIITPPDDFESEIEEFISKNKNVVLFDRYYQNIKHNYVVLDNYQSTKRSTELFVNKGFKEIGFVGLNSDLSVIKDRQKGYFEVINRENLIPYNLMIDYDKVDTVDGIRMFETFIDENPKLDSILFATNSLAIIGLKVLKKKNIKIPSEMGILTFEDRDLFEHHSPSISVLRQPIAELAGELINKTLELMNTKRYKNKVFQVVLSGELIPRDSTQKSAEIHLSDKK